MSHRLFSPRLLAALVLTVLTLAATASPAALLPPLDSNDLQQLVRSAAGRPVVVAVLDSGVDYRHEDLRGKMWINEAERQGQDHVDDDGNGCVDDIYGCDLRGQVYDYFGYHPGLGGADYETDPYLRPDGIGHGTHVAGVIAARRDNGTGINGVSVDARIMAVTFILPNNSARMSDAALAIRYAVDNGADIINASFGRRHLSDKQRDALAAALDYAAEHKVLVVASAGNYGVDIDKGSDHFFPASFEQDNLLTVAAVTAEGELWPASNFGAHSIDVAAPGVDILSTVPAGPTSLFRKLYDPSGYKVSEGTSVATPYVTGLAAQLLAHNHDLNPQQLRGAVMDLAETRPSLVGKTVRGGEIPALWLSQ
jgi:subtilisin family serine protease